jgi:hypothetical protein
MYPERVPLHGNLRRHFAVVHSPEEAAEQTGQMPTTQVEAAERATGGSEESRRQLRQTFVSYPNLHMSDRALVISALWVVLTVEQLKIRWTADGVDDVRRQSRLCIERCE